MKRAHLVFFCLVIAAPLYAQTITKVTLTGGSITAGPGSVYGEDPVTSFLTAPGYTITNVSGDDPANVGIGAACYNGCTLAQIASYIGSEFGIIGFPPNGSMAAPRVMNCAGSPKDAHCHAFCRKL